MSSDYLHGYNDVESKRLESQANFLEDYIFNDVNLNESKTLIEIGCGIGAQTEILLKRFPDIAITAIDISEEQIQKAKENFTGIDKRVVFECQDASHLTFKDNSFDSAFICWVLEHVNNPLEILKEAFRVLKPGGKLYVTEVHNDSFYLNKICPSITAYWKAFNEFQYSIGGNPEIGINLGTLLLDSGFKNPYTYALTLHHDRRNIDNMRFMLDYMESLMLSAADKLLNSKRITMQLKNNMQKEILNLKNDKETIFFYTAVRAIAIKN
jgi:SAM-dependent methyltransferase